MKQRSSASPSYLRQQIAAAVIDRAGAGEVESFPMTNEEDTVPLDDKATRWWLYCDTGKLFRWREEAGERLAAKVAKTGKLLRIEVVECIRARNERDGTFAEDEHRHALVELPSATCASLHDTMLPRGSSLPLISSS